MIDFLFEGVGGNGLFVLFAMIINNEKDKMKYDTLYTIVIVVVMVTIYGYSCFSFELLYTHCIALLHIKSLFNINCLHKSLGKVRLCLHFFPFLSLLLYIILQVFTSFSLLI